MSNINNGPEGLGGDITYLHERQQHYSPCRVKSIRLKACPGVPLACLPFRRRECGALTSFTRCSSVDGRSYEHPFLSQSRFPLIGLFHTLQSRSRRPAGSNTSDSSCSLSHDLRPRMSYQSFMGSDTRNRAVRPSVYHAISHSLAPFSPTASRPLLLLFHNDSSFLRKGGTQMTLPNLNGRGSNAQTTLRLTEYVRSYTYVREFKHETPKCSSRTITPKRKPRNISVLRATPTERVSLFSCRVRVVCSPLYSSNKL